jgi:hypothetical protein
MSKSKYRRKSKYNRKNNKTRKSNNSRQSKIDVPPQLPLDKSEKVLFIGKYNIDDQINNGVTYSLLPTISINPNGYNPYVGNYYNITDGQKPPNILLLEYNNIASYSSDLNTKLGQISMEGLGLNNTMTVVASVGYREFNITSSNGIYKDVTKVIFDNTTPPHKTIYFIGKK